MRMGTLLGKSDTYVAVLERALQKKEVLMVNFEEK